MKDKSKPDKDISKELKEIKDELRVIKCVVLITQQRQEEFMSQVFTDLESLRTAVNDATNKVATRIDSLSSRITNSMTNDEVASLKAGFQAEVDRLTALGSDPDDPVPA